VTDTTATAGQTSFSTPSYTVGYIDVYRNGVRLVSTDYTATTGTTVVLNNACTVGDAVVTESFYVSSVLNAIPATAGAISLTSATYLTGQLPVANGGTGDSGTAWTAYTPTITANSGSFTTVSATGTYKTLGKTCWFTTAITITTAGTAGGFMGVSLPVTQVGATLAAYGMEMNSTGYMVKGYIPASGVMQVTKYDNATIIGSGYLIRLTGTYETA
jgi:hypothetical protein